MDYTQFTSCCVLFMYLRCVGFEIKIHSSLNLEGGCECGFTRLNILLFDPSEKQNGLNSVH